MKMASSSYFTNEIIITAMDRFVWFVLLVVMSHLVTEFTRVTGYASGARNEMVLVNDSLLQPMPVQNMLLYPGHEYASVYNRPAHYEQNAAFVVGAPGVATVGGSGVGGSTAANNEQGFPFFSFRPLIDSIFEIPISTLRAVNNLVARLTGSYRQATQEAEVTQKSAKITLEAAPQTIPVASETTQIRLPTTRNNHILNARNGIRSGFEATPLEMKPSKKTLMHEKIA